jgi:hypothetical protein
MASCQREKNLLRGNFSSKKVFSDVADETGEDGKRSSTLQTFPCAAVACLPVTAIEKTT